MSSSSRTFNDCWLQWWQCLCIAVKIVHSASVCETGLYWYKQYPVVQGGINGTKCVNFYAYHRDAQSSEGSVANTTKSHGSAALSKPYHLLFVPVLWGHGVSRASAEPALHIMVGEMAVSSRFFWHSNTAIASVRCVRRPCEGVYHYSPLGRIRLFFYSDVFVLEAVGYYCSNLLYGSRVVILHCKQVYDEGLMLLKKAYVCTCTVEMATNVKRQKADIFIRGSFQP